jgi:hypothetical protein
VLGAVDGCPMRRGVVHGAGRGLPIKLTAMPGFNYRGYYKYYLELFRRKRSAVLYVMNNNGNLVVSRCSYVICPVLAGWPAVGLLVAPRCTNRAKNT